MPKDKYGKVIKPGDTVGVQFIVEESTHDGTGTNLRLRARHLPAGEHTPILHINSGAVHKLDGEPASEPPVDNRVDTTNPPAA